MARRSSLLWKDVKYLIFYIGLFRADRDRVVSCYQKIRRLINILELHFARVLQLPALPEDRLSYFFFSTSRNFLPCLLSVFITNNCIAVSRVSFQVIYGVSESAVIARPDESY